AEDVTRLRRLTAGEVDAHAGRVALELLRTRDPAGEALADRKSLLRDVDGRLQNFLEGHGAPAVEEQIPRVDRAGNRARQQPRVDGDFPRLVLLVPLDGSQPRRGALGVDREDLLGARVVNQQYGVAADTVGRGVDEPEHGLPGHDRVEGVPT